MESIINVKSSLSVDDATEAIKEAAAENGFGVVGFHNINETLESKGVECPTEVRIVEVCNPQVAASMLEMVPDVAPAMPCRIAIFDRAGQTTMSCISTNTLLGLFPMPAGAEEQSSEFANQVQDVLNRIMDAASG